MIYPADPNRDEFYTYSQATIGNAGNIRLQDLRLGYSPNRATAQWLKSFKTLEFFVYASNLGIVWRANKWGIDPDYGSGIPTPLTLSLGLTGTF